MRHARKLLVPLVMAGCAAGAMLLRGPLAEANANRRVPGVRYAPRPKLARFLALGHRSAAADLLWLSAIGDLSREFGDPERKRRWLHSIFDAVTSLEPTFASVYSFGATYLTLIDPDKNRAIELLELGVARNPDDLRLAIELAMTYYRDLHDRAATLRVLERVVKDPRCDSVHAGFYSSLLVDSREDFAALAQWEAWREHPNEIVKEVAELQQERAKRRIALRAIAEFRQTHGRAPLTRDDLREPGLMAPSVVDVVLDSLWIDTAARPQFSRCDEFERRQNLRVASRWVAQFRAVRGRPPTIDELLANRWLLPAPPGSHVEIVGEDVRLADDVR